MALFVASERASEQTSTNRRRNKTIQVRLLFLTLSVEVIHGEWDDVLLVVCVCPFLRRDCQDGRISTEQSDEYGR